MSRREEVEASIVSADGEYCNNAWVGPESLRYLARTLADEVDARDAVITKLLEMLEPKNPCPKHEDFVPFDYDKWNDATCAWMRVDDLYNRALEIAGRKE